MVSLLITLAQFWSAVRTAWRDPSFRTLASLTGLLLFVGTLVFHEVEGWAYLDSFYFSAITLATVDYSDFTPQTPAGKLLTVFSIFMGFGLLVALLTRLAEVLIQSEQEGRERRRLRRMQTRAQKASCTAKPVPTDTLIKSQLPGNAMTVEPLTSSPANSYSRYWQASFNRPDYYPLDRKPDPDLFQPLGGWMGRLVLPPPEQREQVRGALIEIHHAPLGHDALVGTQARLRWAETAQNNKIYWSLTRQVLFDDRARKAAAEGVVLPERLQGLTLVNPFESLAGAHPHDDIVVRLPEPVGLDLQPADGGAPILFAPRQPVQISGRYYALVRFDGPADGADRYRVTHYRRASGAFDGPATVVQMPFVVANQDGVLPFTNTGIERSPAGADGWYIYGACDRDGAFVVQALAPRRLLRLHPERVIGSRDEALNYVGKDGTKNAAARKGQATSVFLAPEGRDSAEAQADWQEGDEALLIHVYGGIGGEQAEPALKATPLYWGHFAFGVARVVREPLADDLSFDIEYLQVYAHNHDGLTSGALHWSRYMGDRQYGWLGTRPVRDVILRLPCFTGRRGQTSVTPLDLTRRYLEMMTARYRIGGGSGSSLVTPAYNCAQDSNQSLYAAFKVISQNLARQERQRLTDGNQIREQDLADLLALGADLERYLVPFGGARTDWASDAGVLGGSAEQGGFQNVLTALRSWRTMLPSLAARTLVRIFLRHGAAAWVLDTYQCGGDNPRIAPVMPNV